MVFRGIPCKSSQEIRLKSHNKYLPTSILQSIHPFSVSPVEFYSPHNFHRYLIKKEKQAKNSPSCFVYLNCPIHNIFHLKTLNRWTNAEKEVIEEIVKSNIYIYIFFFIQSKNVSKIIPLAHYTCFPVGANENCEEMHWNLCEFP